MEDVLSPNEKKVLKSLSSSEKRIEEIAKETGLSKEATLQASYMLDDKGLAKVNERKRIFFRLTKEGEEYARKGLPERRCFELLYSKSNKIPISQIKELFGEKEGGIAIGWMKKKGWARVEDGMLILLSAPCGEDEFVLELLHNGQGNEEILHRFRDSIEELMRRGIVVSEETKEFYVSATKEGIALSNKIELEEEISQLTPDIIRRGEWEYKRFRRYDIRSHAKSASIGKIHPYQRLIEEMREIFLSMGFKEIKGEIIQSSFWNFDALFQPQDHPAREMQDTFYLDSMSELPNRYENVKEVHEGKVDYTEGWGGVWSEEFAKRNVLRTHTTAITIRYLAENPEPPVKAFCIDRVYRREAIDSTHTPEFEQLEGVVMGEGLSLKHLFGYLKEFYARMGFKDIRFRPGYFPYTEPSVEPEVFIEGLGWIELGGAGIFREEVTKPLGIKYPVLAWGLGISRVAMLRLGLDDLRKLYHPDIEWLRSEPIWRRI